MNLKYCTCRRQMLGLMFVFVFYARVCAESVTKLSSCSCKAENGTVMSLESIASKGSIKYKDLASPLDPQQKYSFNPCYPFTESEGTSPHQHCTNVAACQRVTLDGGADQFYDIGTQESATFEIKKVPALPDFGNILVLTFTAADKERKSELFFVCTEESVDSFKPLGEVLGSTPPLYQFLYVSKHACFGQGSGGLSAGSILLIIFFSSLAAFMVVMLVVNIFVRKKSGKNAVPLLVFVTSTMPGLVKDGFFFVIKRGSYQPIKG